MNRIWCLECFFAIHQDVFIFFEKSVDDSKYTKDVCICIMYVYINLQTYTYCYMLCIFVLLSQSHHGWPGTMQGKCKQKTIKNYCKTFGVQNFSRLGAQGPDYQTRPALPDFHRSVKTSAKKKRFQVVLCLFLLKFHPKV